MAGLFFAFDVSVMPGLNSTSDRTFATVMQNFNSEINGNGLFGLVFTGALLTVGAATTIEYRRGRRQVAFWAGLATVLYLVVLLITFCVNIPLNNKLVDLGNPAKTHDFSVIDKFRTTWETTNIMRTLLNTAALGCAAYAVRLNGRADALATRHSHRRRPGRPPTGRRRPPVPLLVEKGDRLPQRAEISMAPVARSSSVQPVTSRSSPSSGPPTGSMYSWPG
ncbi:DUF1772 domain-containing protein [Streptomyces sp. NPDC056352]|uniref:anthrone oxygenase family protein n=1 Tax=Streptomyces sp. NPDC056352 TaxID=3345791 RepID=UPI0035DFF371